MTGAALDPPTSFPVPTKAFRIAALLGATLIVVGAFVPVNGGGEFGYSYAIFDREVQRELLLFAAEPLAVAAVSALAALFLVGRAPLLTSGLFLAFGLQTLVLFLAHLVGAAFGNPAFNSFRPGGLVGAVGALLLLAAGVMALAPLRVDGRKRTRGTSPGRNDA